MIGNVCLSVCVFSATLARVSACVLCFGVAAQLEAGETLEQCAVRELREESCLTVPLAALRKRGIIDFVMEKDGMMLASGAEVRDMQARGHQVLWTARRGNTSCRFLSFFLKCYPVGKLRRAL